MDCLIGCMNVRGIRTREKRRDILNFMRSTNLSIVCLVDTHISEDLFNFVRAEWGGTAVFSPGTVHSRGVSVFFRNNFGFKIFGSEIDAEGNYIILDVELDGCGRCTMAVLYGPNEDNPGFYRSVFSYITNFENEKVIVVGDWNVTLNPNIDTAHYSSQGNRRARAVILEFMEQECMSDIWRMQHATKRSFTWRRSSPLKLARLDFFLVSADIMRKVIGSDILAGYRSDHSLISIEINENVQNKRGLFWKFNNALLKDSTYIELINKEIEDVKQQYAVPLYTSDEVKENSYIEMVIDDQLFFEVLLCKIRGVTIAYGAKKKRERDIREKALLWQMQIVEGLFGDGEIYRRRLDSLQLELSELRRVKLAGAAQRACARWVQEGETPTKYFCGLEKRQSAAKHIACMSDDDTLISGNEKVLKYIEEHFSNLFKARAVQSVSSYLSEIGVDFPKLTNEEACLLEGHVTLKDACHALYELRNDKSPGPDGFTVNFFKVFWKQLGVFLVRSLNNGYVNDLLSISQRQGIITLIPKGNKPKEFIKTGVLSRFSIPRLRYYLE